MSRAPAKAVPMACLTIGYLQYLLPSAKAMKVAELMQDASSAMKDTRALKRCSTCSRSSLS